MNRIASCLIALSLSLPALAKDELPPEARALIEETRASAAAAQARQRQEAEKPPASAFKEIEEPEPEPTGSRRMKLRKFQSVVNVLREGTPVEVVFRDGQILPLPRGSRQAAIFKVLQNSEATGAQVTVSVDERSGVIHDAEAGGAAAKSGAAAGSGK